MVRCERSEPRTTIDSARHCQKRPKQPPCHRPRPSRLASAFALRASADKSLAPQDEGLLSVSEPDGGTVAAGFRGGDVAVLDLADDLRRAEIERRHLHQRDARGQRGRRALRRSSPPRSTPRRRPRASAGRRSPPAGSARRRACGSSSACGPAAAWCRPSRRSSATGRPSLVRKPGMMVLSGRLDGPTRLGWSGAGNEARAAIVERDAGAGHDDA